MDVTTCSTTSVRKISCVEDFLVSLLWKPEMWKLFGLASSKDCHETPTTFEAVWCFSDEARSRRLADCIAEALDGERFSVWVEPVIGSPGFCTYLALRAQVLEPVS